MWEEDSGKRRAWTVVMVVAGIVLAASLIMLGAIGLSYLQGQQKYDQIAGHAQLDAREGTFEGFSVDWDALLAINDDTVGWVYLPGTAVNYPVVRGEDNDYYLTHDFEGTQGWLANYGAVFMDYRNNPDWTDDAYFVYGHHMNDGSMFADITSLEDQARFDELRTVYLLSPKGDFKLRTFSLIHCEADDPLVEISFATPDERTRYIQNKMDRSVVDIGDVPAAGDIKKIFAFATCDNITNGRYVLYTYIEDTTVADLNDGARGQGGQGVDDWMDDDAEGLENLANDVEQYYG